MTASYELTKGCTALQIPQNSRRLLTSAPFPSPSTCLAPRCCASCLNKNLFNRSKCRERSKRPLLHSAGHEEEEAAVPVLSDGDAGAGAGGGDGELVGQLHATCRENEW